MGGVLGGAAGGAQFAQLFFQRAQLADALGHVVDVFVEQGVDFATVFGGGVFEAQQGANFKQRHVQAAAMADEVETLRVGRFIDAVIALGARRLGQQTLALVVADGVDGHAGGCGQSADFHATSLPA